MSGFFNRRMDGELKPLRSHRIPKRFMFFDTETTVPTKDGSIDSFNLILGCLTYVELDCDLSIKRNETYKFTNTSEFCDILESYSRKKTTLYIFAHNVGFDVRVLDLPKVFNLEGYRSEPPIINERVFIWRVKADRGNYLFLDTSNLGVHSVAGLGRDVGLDKIDIDFDNTNDKDLYEYCKRDVEILSKFVIEYIRFVSDNGLGSFKTTLASQGLTAFRTRFMSIRPVIHTKEKVIQMERNAYHGGRVECFKIGKIGGGEKYYLDINSMYPFAMLSNDLPVSLLGYSDKCSLKSLKVRLSKYYVIADVTVRTDEPVYPVIRDGKLIFPTGHFRVTLNNSELLYAVEHDHIVDIHSSSQYSKGAIFSDYINFFYDLKLQHTASDNKTLRYIVKLFLNTLYGKFGQTKPNRIALGATDFPGVFRLPLMNKETGRHYQEIGWYGTIYREEKFGETSFSFPALAGAITANSRMLLWELIKTAGRENVFYVDTDSLIVNQNGYDNLANHISDNQIGKLKLEKHSPVCIISGNKDYTFGDTSKTKGVPSKAVKLDENSWEYIEFEGFIKWLNNGASGSPRGAHKIKHRRSSYNKGIVMKDGSVNPHVITS